VHSDAYFVMDGLCQIKTTRADKIRSGKSYCCLYIIWDIYRYLIMKSFVSLWNKQSFNFSSDFHDGNFKSFSMLVTEPGSLLYWCLMKRADLLCTISIFLIWFSWSNLIYGYSEMYKHQRNTYKYSFFPPTIKDWNSLPLKLLNIDDVEAFKNSLTSYLTR
jgi:hypothetical protein